MEYAVPFVGRSLNDRPEDLGVLLDAVAERERAAGEAAPGGAAAHPGGQPTGRRWPRKAGFFLRNGGRFYLDTVAPWDDRRQLLEACTVECPDAFSVVRHERALDEMLDVAAKATSSNDKPTHVYRAAVVSTPWGGVGSLGMHESHSVPTASIAVLRDELLPYLVVRQLVCGTGGFFDGRFCVSPRQFFLAPAGEERHARERPFMSTGHAQYSMSGYSRLQIVNGEAARGELTTFLRQSLTSTVVAAIVAGKLPPVPRLRDPVGTAQAISRNPFGAWPVFLDDGRRIDAVDLLLDHYVTPCLELTSPHSEARMGLDYALEVLGHLRNEVRDPGHLSIDWLVKRAILNGTKGIDGSEQGHVWDKDSGLLLDNAYRAVTDPLFQGIERTWSLLRFTDATELARAHEAPPPSTRAAVRLEVLRTFGERITDLRWDRATIDGSQMTFAELEGWEPGRIRALLAAHPTKYAKAEKRGESP